MKKKILALVIGLGLLLVGGDLFAAGDLVVNGKLGVGGGVVGFAKTNMTSSVENIGLALTHTRSTSSSINGASYFVFLDGTTSTYGGEAGGFSNSFAYRRTTDSDSASVLYAGSNQSYVGIQSGSGYTVDNLAGLLVSNGMHYTHSATATLTNGYGIISTGLQKNGTGTLTVSDFRHIYLKDRGDQLGSGSSTLNVTEQTGLWIDKQELGGTNNYGIVLDGDGAGSDLVFGDAGGTCRPSVYSDAGYVKAKNKDCIESPLSPHDPETGEWIFYSKNLKTGKTVRVNMEKLVKAVEKLTGETFMIESIEAK